MSALWSYVLAAIGVTGLWVAATKPRVGWWFNIGAQAVWLAYAIATRQWGFLATAVAYTVVYARLLHAAFATSDAREPGVSTLHDRLVAELDRLTQIARRATAGPWAFDLAGDIYAQRRPPITTHIAEVDSAKDSRQIATFADPSVVLRGLEEDRGILRRHPVLTDADGDLHCPICGWVGSPGLTEEQSAAAGVPFSAWTDERVCAEVRSVARRRLGLNPEEDANG